MKQIIIRFSLILKAQTRFLWGHLQLKQHFRSLLPEANQNCSSQLIRFLYPQSILSLFFLTGYFMCQFVLAFSPFFLLRRLLLSIQSVFLKFIIFPFIFLLLLLQKVFLLLHFQYLFQTVLFQLLLILLQTISLLLFQVVFLLPFRFVQPILILIYIPFPSIFLSATIPTFVHSLLNTLLLIQLIVVLLSLQSFLLI